MLNAYSIACLTCAKAFADHGDGNAAGWAILFMLILLVPLFAVLIFAMLRLAKRERANLDPEFMDDSELEAQS